VTYETRTAGVTVSLDGMANDGEPNEADNVAGGVEKIVGGAGGDKLTGDGAANELYGGPGKDAISGGGGGDWLYGEGDNDTIDAQDGDFGDAVDCGAGTDGANGDYYTLPGARGQPPLWLSDMVRNCESVTWLWATPPILKPKP
jgi:Ca2+-binding RTX toxin-like protein